MQNKMDNKTFEIVSTLTPMINVDLIIKDSNNRVLLSWRNDSCGQGWHVPGRIIRFRESIKDSIIILMETEIKCNQVKDLAFIKNQEFIKHSTDIRGHFISLLYHTFIPDDFIPDNQELRETDQGFLKWFDECPDNLLSWHECYRHYIETKYHLLKDF